MSRSQALPADLSARDSLPEPIAMVGFDFVLKETG
jgi:hypothetical protein